MDWASDHLIEGSPVGVVEVNRRGAGGGAEGTWIVDVRSGAIGVRGTESMETYVLGIGAFAVVQRPTAEPYFLELRWPAEGSGYRSDGWALAGSDQARATFVRPAEHGIEISGVTIMSR